MIACTTWPICCFLTGDAKGLTRVSLLIFELQAVMTLFQEACEAFIEPRWQQSLILVKASIHFKVLLHWAKIRALELEGNLLLATLDPFVSIFSTVSLLCALCIQPFIAELLWFSRFWVKEETGKTPQYFSAAWHQNYCDLKTYLVPRCIYTGSLLSCTLQHSSGPSMRFKLLFSHSDD